MRHLALLVLFATPALADETEASITVARVTAELRGTTAKFSARYHLRVPAALVGQGLASMQIPGSAVITSAVIHAPDGEHRAALVDAEQARRQFEALGNSRGEKRWAIKIEGFQNNIDIAYAVPRALTLTIDFELEAPSCFYRDARYVEVPSEWKPALASKLGRRAGTTTTLDLGSCQNKHHADDHEQLFVMFAAPELSTKPSGVERMGASAARLDLGTAHIARLEVALAKRLADVPPDLATAILVDHSRSLSARELEAQREIVKAYARVAGDTQLQIIAYTRHARALLPSWMQARVAAPRIDRELRALAPRNGSNIDLGFATAARWLAQLEGTKRVILVTDARMSDRLHARISSLGDLLPKGTLVHVVAVDEASPLERDDNSSGAALAQKSGGFAVRVGPPERNVEVDATMLLRPTQIDAFDISAPGWKEFSTVASTCNPELVEGESCVWWGEGDTIAGPLKIEGWIWGTRVDRIVTPNPNRKVELARELSTMSILVDDAEKRVNKAARAVNAEWSLYAEWGPHGGYEHAFGTTRGGMSGRSARIPTVSIGRPGRGRVLPSLDLAPQLAGIVARCNLDGLHVEAEIETTLSEIVEVAVVAPPMVATCVEDAIWDTALVLRDPPIVARSKVVLVP
jgi:hypothetical protein